MQAEQKSRSGPEIIKEHISIIKSLLDRAQKKSRDQEEIALLDRLKKRITLLMQTMGEDALCVAIAPFMNENSENILGRNEKFFLEIDARAEYIKKHGKEPPAEDEYLFRLIDIIKSLYRKIPQKEKDEVYSEVLNLFNDTVEYQIAVPSRFSE